MLQTLIYTIEGSTFLEKLEPVGEGLFSDVYKKKDKVFIISDGRCSMKELLAEINEKIKTLIHIPKMKKLGEGFYNGNDRNFYESEYYPYTLHNSVSETVIGQYDFINMLWQAISRDLGIKDSNLVLLKFLEILKNIEEPFPEGEYFSEAYENIQFLTKELISELVILIESIAEKNYSVVNFDLGYRNVAVDSNGNLILLDLFWLEV